MNEVPADTVCPACQGGRGVYICRHCSRCAHRCTCPVQPLNRPGTQRQRAVVAAELMRAVRAVDRTVAALDPNDPLAARDTVLLEYFARHAKRVGARYAGRPLFKETRR